MYTFCAEGYARPPTSTLDLYSPEKESQFALRIPRIVSVVVDVSAQWSAFAWPSLQHREGPGRAGRPTFPLCPLVAGVSQLAASFPHHRPIFPNPTPSKPLLNTPRSLSIDKPPPHPSPVKMPTRFSKTRKVSSTKPKMKAVWKTDFTDNLQAPRPCQCR